MNNRSKFLQQLTLHEGSRSHPYRCTSGKLTIGVGRNIEDRGLSPLEIQYLLDNDVKIVENEINSIFTQKEISKMGDVRMYAVLDMLFNLGAPTFKKFKKCIAALKIGDFETASIEMLDSRWAKQVGKRSIRLADQIRTGTWSQ